MGRGRVRAVHGVDEVNRQIGHLVVESQLPRQGQDAGTDYTGQGHVMVRDPETEVVRDALRRIVSRHPGRADGGAVTNVVMISPGYPQEMAYFTRGLAAVGATVIGVGDQPRDALPGPAQEALSHYEHVSLADEGAVAGGAATGCPATSTSTRWSACGSRT